MFITTLDFQKLCKSQRKQHYAPFKNKKNIKDTHNTIYKIDNQQGLTV